MEIEGKAGTVVEQKLKHKAKRGWMLVLAVAFPIEDDDEEMRAVVTSLAAALDRPGLTPSTQGSAELVVEPSAELCTVRLVPREAPEGDDADPEDDPPTIEMVSARQAGKQKILLFGSEPRYVTLRYEAELRGCTRLTAHQLAHLCDRGAIVTIEPAQQELPLDKGVARAARNFRRAMHDLAPGGGVTSVTLSAGGRSVTLGKPERAN